MKAGPSVKGYLRAVSRVLDIIINLHHEAKVQDGQAAIGRADQVARVRIRHQPACKNHTCLLGRQPILQQGCHNVHGPLRHHALAQLGALHDCVISEGGHCPPVQSY